MPDTILTKAIDMQHKLEDALEYIFVVEGGQYEGTELYEAGLTLVLLIFINLFINYLYKKYQAIVTTFTGFSDEYYM